MTRMRLVLRRVLQALPALFGIVVITFLLTRALPGDPAAYFAGPAATPESVAQIRHNLGLDRPLPAQFASYVADLARGDLGQSLTTGQPVGEALLQRLPASLELTFSGLLIAVVLGLPLGVVAATRPDSWVDHLCRVVATAGVSLPTFFTGLLLVSLFYVALGWAPAPMGRLDIAFSPPDGPSGFFIPDALLEGDLALAGAAARQLVLPALTLGLFTLAPIARMARAAMLAALASDYIRTARAAGLSRRQVLITYALGNAILPVITTLGMVFSFTLGANVLVEKVFAWPGIGSFAVDALTASDYAAVQGFVLAMAVLFIVLNLAIDVIVTLADPRVSAR